MENDGQLDFDFSPPADDALPEFPRDPLGRGYKQFVKERKAAIERLSKKFGVMLEEKVRLKLIGWDEEFTGRLMLNTLLLPESKKDEVPLRIGRVTFDLRDIERCFRV
ncbi:MAG: hypothetical protein MUC65_05555 [Pontiellaceae bacterium]|jgi:hypothetical protein|nr:hypothetical protein [Pontiellaceae bacterium]